MLVLDIGIPSHSARRRSENLRPQTHVLLTCWAKHERGPAWIRVNTISGTCHLLWLIDLIAAVADITSANTRLLTATTN